MKIIDIRTLAGPNIYSHRPVLIMRIQLEELANRESREFPAFNTQLLELLPGVKSHFCSKGEPGGFIERLKSGTYFGHIIEHIALELTELAGVPVFHGKTRETEIPGCYKVIVEYSAEQGTRYLLETAVAFTKSLLKGKSFPLQEKIEEAKRIIARTEPGPSTKAILDVAIQRGIPWRRIGSESLVQLGYGKHRRFIQAALSSQTSAIAVDIACDKELTKTLLREAGIPVPEGNVVRTWEEALQVRQEIAGAVVVKPYNGCQGKGVSLNITTEPQLESAYRVARQYADKIVMEEMLQGRDYRVLIVNGKMVAACERVPAKVIGDGTHTIAELIEIVNQDPARGDGHDKSLTRLQVDPMMIAYLQKCDLTIKSTPSLGEQIFLRECANLSTGGTAKDVTELVHPEMASLCERAARIIGLDICGIDLIVQDIAAPPDGTGGIVEMNAAPGLRMHVAPSEGQRRAVGEAVIEMLYPTPSQGRIPIISITGTNGKTTITRMIAHVLAATGQQVGMTTTDGIYLGTECLMKGDTTGPQSARLILSDPQVEVAVLETARGGIARGGLGYDWSDISIISNIRPDHIGQDGIKNLDDLVHIKSLVAERVRAGGTLILNADDERLVKLAAHPRTQREKKNIVWFSLRPGSDVIRQHLQADGTAFLLRNGWLIEATRYREMPIVRANDLPVTIEGAATFHIANTLAVVAACRAYGLGAEFIVPALKEFQNDLHNPGRTGLFQVAGGYVLLDYGHNPDAFDAIGRLAKHWRGHQITGIIGVPGDRDNSIIQEAGRVVARAFDRVLVREDQDLRGRRSGETAELLCEAIKEAAPQTECRVVLDEITALRTALDDIRPGEIIVHFYEKSKPVLNLLQEYQAKPARGISAIASYVKAAPQRENKVRVL